MVFSLLAYLPVGALQFNQIGWTLLRPVSMLMNTQSNPGTNLAITGLRSMTASYSGVMPFSAIGNQVRQYGVNVIEYLRRKSSCLQTRRASSAIKAASVCSHQAKQLLPQPAAGSKTYLEFGPYGS